MKRTLQPHGLAGLLTGSIKQIGHFSSSLSTSELILSKLPDGNFAQFCYNNTSKMYDIGIIF